MPEILGFGEFQLDELRFELRRAGQPVTAQPKVLRVLIYLVSNRNRSVSSRELLEAVWPAEAVTIASVKRAIGGARRALGENGDSESSIRTVRGHGYQFVRSVHVVSAPVLPAASPTPPQSTTVAANGCWAERPYVGRDSVLAALERMLGEVIGGRGRRLLVSGEPGCGKSRTLRELARLAQAAGARIAWVRCTSWQVAPELWPVRQMLREVALHVQSSLPRDRDATGREELRAAIAELTDPPAQPAGPNPAARPPVTFSFLDAAGSVLRQLSAREPVVLLFDDLHHADEATLRVIAVLMQQLEDARVLLAGATRATLPPERELHSAVYRELSSCRLELEGLTRADLARFITARGDDQRAAAALEALHDWTAGNPRLVDHVLEWKSVFTAGARPWWLAFESCAQAAGSGALVERHLEGLAQRSRELLLDAAILGRSFSLAQLARMQDRSALRVLELLSDALTLGVIRKRPDTIAEYEFVHALVHQVSYESMPRGERAQRHARAGLAIEAGGAADDPTSLDQLAEHFLRAAPGHDDGRAVRYATQAARAALARSEYEAAVGYYERALQLSELGAGGLRERMSLLLDKGEALACANDTLAAQGAVSAAATLARELADVDGIARAAGSLARLPFAGIVDEPHVALIEEALARLPEHDARRPVLQSLLARVRIWSRNPAERAERARSAVAAAQGVRDPHARGEALIGCLHALADPHCLEQRLSICEELERLGREHGERRLLRSAAAGRVWACVELGDMPGADSSISAIEVFASQGPDPMARWQAKVFRAMRAIVAGRLVVAARLSHEALELGTKLGRTNAYHVYCTQVGGILRLEGKLEEAAALVRDISLRHPAIGGWQAALAGLEAELGRRQPARDVLARLLERDLAALHADPFALGALAPAADLCMQVGTAAQARSLYEALLPYASRHGVISTGINTHGPLARHLGGLALRMGDAALAEHHLRRAVAAAEAIESPTFISSCCLAYAFTLIKAGPPNARERAAALATRAHQLACDHGLRGLAKRATALAGHANLALRAPRRRVTEFAADT